MIHSSHQSAMQSEATLYLADKRGCTQSAGHRSFHIFNFGEYYNPHRKPVGILRAFNDETLRQGCSRGWEIDEDTEITLIPIVGNIHVKKADGVNHFVEAGQVLSFFAAANERFEISNPFMHELVNFLQIWSVPDRSKLHRETKSESGFTAGQNKLVPLTLKTEHEEKVMGHIGKYAGRGEGACAVSNIQKGVFVFVIEGAFEVQNRLVQSRDGLSLKNIARIDFEALTEDGVILILQQA